MQEDKFNNKTSTQYRPFNYIVHKGKVKKYFRLNSKLERFNNWNYVCIVSLQFSYDVNQKSCDIT